MIRDMALAQGVQLQGNAQSGNVVGDTVYKGVNVHLEGHYQSSGSQISITVTDKPFLAPCGVIRDKLQEGINKIDLPVVPGPNNGNGNGVVEMVPDVEPSIVNEPGFTPDMTFDLDEVDAWDADQATMAFSIEEVDAWEREQLARKQRNRWALGLLAVAVAGVVVWKRR